MVRPRGRTTAPASTGFSHDESPVPHHALMFGYGHGVYGAQSLTNHNLATRHPVMTDR